MPKLGGMTSCTLVVLFVAPQAIYLSGDLRTPFGPITHDLAVFQYRPAWSASLATLVLAVRERIGRHAPRPRVYSRE